MRLRRAFSLSSPSREPLAMAGARSPPRPSWPWQPAQRTLKRARPASTRSPDPLTGCARLPSKVSSPKAATSPAQPKPTSFFKRRPRLHPRHLSGRLQLRPSFASTELCGLGRRQSFHDDLGKHFRLGLARGLVTELRHRNAETYAVLTGRHAITPPERIVGADLDRNRLGVDIVVLERSLEIVQELARVVRTARPVHDSKHHKAAPAQPQVGIGLDPRGQRRRPDACRGM